MSYISILIPEVSLYGRSGSKSYLNINSCKDLLPKTIQQVFFLMFLYLFQIVDFGNCFFQRVNEMKSGFGWTGQNSMEPMLFHKISIPGNQVKFRCFKQCNFNCNCCDVALLIIFLLEVFYLFRYIYLVRGNSLPYCGLVLSTRLVIIFKITKSYYKLKRHFHVFQTRREYSITRSKLTWPIFVFPLTLYSILTFQMYEYQSIGLTISKYLRHYCIATPWSHSLDGCLSVLDQL